MARKQVLRLVDAAARSPPGPQPRRRSSPHLGNGAAEQIRFGPMFQAVLKEVVEGTEGGLATLLMDFEGIAVESYSKPGS